MPSLINIKQPINTLRYNKNVLLKTIAQNEKTPVSNTASLLESNVVCINLSPNFYE